MAFAAYLNFVTGTVSKQISDQFGTEVTAVSLAYNGVIVPFHYQFWRVKEQSVCYSYTNNIQDFSSCTIEAKKLFSDLCVGLQKRPETGWRHKKTKNMYCNAAALYKPTIANISKGSYESKLLLARKKCNVATAHALGSFDVTLQKLKNDACAIYEAEKKLEISR
jgi:hypothetical protein